MRSNATLALTEQEPYGFVYLGFQAEAVQKAPLYRRTAARRREASRLIEAAASLEDLPDVHSVRVFRTRLVAPLSGAPRHDLAMLIRSTRVESMESVRTSDSVRALGATEVLVGSNAARIGDTEADENGYFLFNHFTATGDADPVEIWLGLTNWYTSTVGVDNSTALRPSDEDAEFALVNYVRLPTNPPLFLLSQLLRPSFHQIVRGTLRRNGMRALPCFYRMIR